MHETMMRAAENAGSWPFREARALLARVEKDNRTRPILFSTGYGPSGFPHMGTFGEVARTAMVRHAFETLTGGDIPTRLICVSDDMDGLRTIPEHIADHQKLRPYLQHPLARIPDPFGTHESFGAHMNAHLRAFLDRFGLAYEFVSSAALYESGAYDTHLHRALASYDRISGVVAPTLGEERRKTYSPFLPISPATGRILYSPPIARDPERGLMTFVDEDGTDFTIPVGGGRVKLQWKADFGMRWAALGVDFEMFGKDHRANAHLYAKICSILGGVPPRQFVYELFLDQDGEKISKSKGNGIAVDQWLTYAIPESLSLLQFHKPMTAKRLSHATIVRMSDDYVSHARRYREQSLLEQLDNPVWHIHAGQPPPGLSPLSYSMLLNLAAASNASDRRTLQGFVRSSLPGASEQDLAAIDRMIDGALAYHADIARKDMHLRAPTPVEEAALSDLADRLEALDQTGAAAEAQALQTLVFDVGKTHRIEPLRDWFGALYRVLLGQPDGPRFGSFIAIYGIDRTVYLIRSRLREVASP